MPWATVDDVLAADIKDGQTVILNGVASGSLTAATATSGGISGTVLPNNQGSTLWGTLKGVPMPDGLENGSDVRVLFAKNGSTRAGTYWIGLLHKVGVVNLAATGQQLTHVAAGFPLTRLKGSGASVPVRGIPLLLTTTALSTTAAVISNIKYRNQAGNVITGTQSFTYPSSTTVVGSTFFPSLERGDCAIQDVTEVNVGTASATGAAALYLFEPIVPLSIFVAGSITQTDLLRGARFGLPRVNEPVPASGSIASQLAAVLCSNVASTNTGTFLLRLVKQA